MGSYFRGLWRHPDFLKLWTGQTISVFGSQITLLALPLLAAVTLQASPMEMGVLLAVETMLLDWQHLKQKCYDLSSRICRGTLAKAPVVRRLYRRLWRGDVPGARAVLEAERPETKNEAKLDELSGYLQARVAWIPNYRQRRIERKYVGSAHVEKANDLIIARRQKNRGMQWSEATSDALAALRTLMLNGGWDRYWQQREVLPLLAS